MSGIAALCSSSDTTCAARTRRARSKRIGSQQLGLRFFSPHRAEDANDAELIIFSSAIKEDNPILAARASAGNSGDSPR